jgi:cobyrinic acid a,c-diamide synthase
MTEMVRKAAADGMPMYAECGGLMYMARGLTHEGKSHRMAGVFDMETEMTGQVTLNYTRGVTGRSPVSGRGGGFRGHEFHYSRAADVPDDAVFAQRLDIGEGIRDGMDGIMAHNAMASYGHLYLSAKAASTLVGHCVRYSRR